MPFGYLVPRTQENCIKVLRLNIVLSSDNKEIEKQVSELNDFEITLNITVKRRSWFHFSRCYAEKGKK